jgi:Spx/MgsR family transcriptional regulator
MGQEPAGQSRSVEIYVHPTCTGCRRAEEFLRAQGIEYQRRDYFSQRFTREELVQLLERTGLSPRELLSTRSRAYRELGLEEREVSDDELIDLMVREPGLLRRPVVVIDRVVVVGSDRKRLAAALAGEGGERAGAPGVES